MAADRRWTRSVAGRCGRWRRRTDLNAAVVNATFAFYRARGFYPTLMPVTVGSVSSPMGLGSDSLPVAVDLFGTRTYLADSMQFQLEFMLRHRGPGAYYVMPTFRGEDPDGTHLNQFFHSEAELVGGFEEVLQLVEAYTRDLAGALVRDCGPLVTRIVGGNDHLKRLAASGPLPRVTVDEARKILPDEMFQEVAPGVPAITRQGERALADAHGGAVWLTHPPGLSVPFYQSVGADGRAECADLMGW